MAPLDAEITKLLAMTILHFEADATIRYNQGWPESTSPVWAWMNTQGADYQKLAFIANSDHVEDESIQIIREMMQQGQLKERESVFVFDINSDVARQARLLLEKRIGANWRDQLRLYIYLERAKGTDSSR